MALWHAARQLPPSFRGSRACLRGMCSAAEFDPAALDSKWQRRWREDWKRSGDPAQSRYVLAMFPYPSGNLHMGHVRVYAIGDCIARAHRMKGRSVLFPMGWDAFGLPAENAALERGVPADEWTFGNIDRMREQLRSLGLSFDWDAELMTAHPDYYKWTQWLFLKLHRAGLAYRAEAEVNWDPVDGTVLANEQVDAQGRSWRSGAVVEKRKLQQWFFRTTAFAEELLAGCDGSADGALANWPESVRSMQANWIGRSVGARVSFRLESTASGAGIVGGVGGDGGFDINVFTTRPDTLFGVSYVALSLDHPILREPDGPAASCHAELERLRASQGQNSAARSEFEADSEVGVLLPLEATHPLTGERLPVYAAPYVLSEYGEGAVMGVPAHDERDHRFMSATAPDERARWYRRVVVQGADGGGGGGEAAELGAVHAGRGRLAGSGAFDGMLSEEAAPKIVAALGARGAPHTTYRLRDWLVSRQRYWGTPIPMVHCDTCGVVPVPEEELPVLLRRPGDEAEELRRCPRCGSEGARRDPDTLDTFVDSSWYFLRFCDPRNAALPFSRAEVERWVGERGVDVYIGGIEHAILHLLYARFVHRFLQQDLGVECAAEPFDRLLAQAGEIALYGIRLTCDRDSFSATRVDASDEQIEGLG